MHFTRYENTTELASVVKVKCHVVGLNGLFTSIWPDIEGNGPTASHPHAVASSACFEISKQQMEPGLESTWIASKAVSSSPTGFDASIYTP